MFSGHREVAQAEALVGGLLSVGFVAMAAAMQHEDTTNAANMDCAGYLRRVEANARQLVRQDAAARMKGAAALIAAYNRRIATRG